jgi:hypothetical protein
VEQPALDPQDVAKLKQKFAAQSTADLLDNVTVLKDQDGSLSRLITTASVQVLNDRGKLIGGVAAILTGGAPVPIDLIEIDRLVRAKQTQPFNPGGAIGMPNPPKNASEPPPTKIPDQPINPSPGPVPPTAPQQPYIPPGGALGLPLPPTPKSRHTPAGPTPDQVIVDLINDP